MKNYKLSAEAIVMISGSSAGTQPKYYENGYWYKTDRMGYEGTAEHLMSVVLSCSDYGPAFSQSRHHCQSSDGSISNRSCL